ncbi:unnamed protein product, partial [Mesorhabditis belari]|uniref:Dynactin subunit 5 n=1 Tax=Mesorhabditis belari TaxID=2138241 RepID=A0AAF3ETC8_9BILA
MDLPLIVYSPEEYIETSTGNKVYKKASIYGSQNIVLSGKCVLQKDCILRGDLAPIRMGKFGIIGENSVIRPSFKNFINKGPQGSFIHVKIGDHVFIGKSCIIMAGQISSYCHIGDGAILGQSCVLKECCEVQAEAVIAPDSVFPPFSLIGGNPARVIGSTAPCTADMMIEATQEYYENFVPKTSARAALM